jgi:hypothetical protein
VQQLFVFILSICGQISLLGFIDILYYVMGFERYGSFVLMLIRITIDDLPIFVVIYSIFLFGCTWNSYNHYEWMMFSTDDLTSLSRWRLDVAC